FFFFIRCFYFHVFTLFICFLFFFLMLRRPPRSTLFPTRRSSDLKPPFASTLSPTRASTSETFAAGFPRATGCCRTGRRAAVPSRDRKSTRLNSSHDQISYAVFCLKKKKKTNLLQTMREFTTCQHD